MGAKLQLMFQTFISAGLKVFLTVEFISQVLASAFLEHITAGQFAFAQRALFFLRQMNHGLTFFRTAILILRLALIALDEEDVAR